MERKLLIGNLPLVLSVPIHLLTALLQSPIKRLVNIINFIRLEKGAMSNYERMSQSELEQAANRGEGEAEYELAYRYMSRGDSQNAFYWYRRIADNPSHPRHRYGVTCSAEILVAFGNKKEAIRLLETITDNPNAIVARLALGLLYCEEGKIEDGINLIEYSVGKIIETDGNDNYLKQIECYKIGIAYEGAQHFSKSTSYYKKAIERCDTSYESDRQLISQARAAIADNERRKSILEDRG
jgi:tetratricopeptide (TPR) repeat protein